MVQGCTAHEGRDRRSGQAEGTRAANTESLEREQFSRRAKCSLSFQLLTRTLCGRSGPRTLVGDRTPPVCTRFWFHPLAPVLRI